MTAEPPPLEWMRSALAPMTSRRGHVAFVERQQVRVVFSSTMDSRAMSNAFAAWSSVA